MWLKVQLALKRSMDVILALMGLLALSPVLLLIAVAIKWESPRYPILFNDFVMGRGQGRFKMFKYRTMLPHEIDYNERSEIRPGNPLVARVGAVLRRLKLDELPQLWNVFRGEMSLVGPRPMDPFRFARADEFQRQRLVMRPGLTGWAQVNGNIHWDWQERIEMDVWYIANWSLWLDLEILWKTASVLLLGERPKDVVLAKRITDCSYRLQGPGQAFVSPDNSVDPATISNPNKG